MSDLTIREYQQIIDDWINTVGVRYFSELTNLAQLVEEVGEVARPGIRRSLGDLYRHQPVSGRVRPRLPASVPG